LRGNLSEDVVLVLQKERKKYCPFEAAKGNLDATLSRCQIRLSRRKSSRAILLSRAAKELKPGKIGRWSFLGKYCGVPAAIFPVRLRGWASPLAAAFGPQNSAPWFAGYRLHPHYPAPSPLEDRLRKTQVGLDAFIAGKNADLVEENLAKWSSSLRQSP
jgi:hypothetical protein